MKLINRYQDAPKDVYNDLYALVRDKDYFVLTTNVDHCFQKAGFHCQKNGCRAGEYAYSFRISPALSRLRCAYVNAAYVCINLTDAHIPAEI